MKEIDREKLDLMIEFYEKLSEGIEPITDTQITTDRLLLSNRYRKVFCSTVTALKDLTRIIDRQQAVDSRRKAEFQLSDSEKKQVPIMEEAISISRLTYNINSVIDVQNMKKIKATQITFWLQEEGYLHDNVEEKTARKICMPKGSELGIIEQTKVNDYGNQYRVNHYNETAQRYIIANINKVLFL